MNSIKDIIKCYLPNVTTIYSFLGIKKNDYVSILDGWISNSTRLPSCNCIEYCEKNGGSFERGSERRKQGANTKVLWNSYKARRHEYRREHVGSQDLILRPLGLPLSLSFLVPPLPHFFIVLSCRDLPVRKPPLGVTVMRQSDTRFVVCTPGIRTQVLQALSQNVFLSRVLKSAI